MKFSLKNLLVAASLALAAGASQADTTTVKIIGFNDFHGNLNSPGTFALFAGGTGVNKPAAGGADYVAGYIANLTASSPYSVVVHAGDMVGASPLVSGLFYDEGAIETMNRAGVNVASVGNHEFDKGMTELLRKQRGGCVSVANDPTQTHTCQGATVGTPVPFEGAKFKYLAANVTVNATGKTLFPPYAVKTFGSVRVGFIGMTLAGTPTLVTPSGVAGLTFNDEVATVNGLIAKLHGLGVNAIVVVIHQGGFQGTDAPNYINDCSLTSGHVADPTALEPLRDIVAGLDDSVDLVISGHTHTGYNCVLPTSGTTKPGHTVRVTQASSFGRVLSNIDMTIDNSTGSVTNVAATNVVVDRTNPAITPNATIASIVAGYNTLAAPLGNQIIGQLAAPATNAANAAGEMDAGDLIADAQLSATSAPAFGGAVIAFMNAGGVRSPGFVAADGIYPHNLTYGEAFTVQPFGDSLTTMTLTDQQIKDVLEQQFVGCNGQTSTKIMQISIGFSFSWSASAPACSKIVDVTFNGTPIVQSGVVLNPTHTYRIECNNFLQNGGDGFTVFKLGTNQLGGAQDIDDFVAYYEATYAAPNAPYDPTALVALQKPRITKLP